MTDPVPPNRAARRRAGREAAKPNQHQFDPAAVLIQLEKDAEQWQVRTLIALTDDDFAGAPAEMIEFARAAMDGVPGAIDDLELQTMLAVTMCTIWADTYADGSSEAFEDMLGRTGHVMIREAEATHFAIDRFDVFSNVMPILDHRVALVGLRR